MAKVIILVVCSWLFVGYEDARAEEDWALYGISKYFLFYYDSKSVTRPSDEIVRLRTKTVSKCNDDKDWAIKNHPNCAKTDFEYVLTLMEIDCPNKRDREIESVGYSKEGKALESFFNEHAEWSDINPGSYSEVVFLSLCPPSLRGGKLIP